MEDIAREAGVAKGTVYLYFRSKREILSGLAEAVVARMAGSAADIVASGAGTPLDTFVAAILAIGAVGRDDRPLADLLERPENLELHERTNIALVRQLGPVLAGVVAEGCASGDFDVDDPLSTIQFILAGQAFLLGNDRFGWNAAEREARLMATLVLCERALGARPGALVGGCLGALSDIG